MATKKGTSANDTISGATTDTTIFGYNGNDTITTLITTGTGPVIYGGGGNDKITTTGAKDRLFGGDGSDTINSGAGNDKDDGGNGNDVITSGDGNDYVLGNVGNDTLVGGSGMQTVYGGAGNDYIGAGTDATATNKHYFYGMTGADTINANVNAADDPVVGLTATTGSVGLNYLYGGADNDKLIGSVSGYDTINGGAGTNTIVGGGALTGGLSTGASDGANHARETVSYLTVGKGAADATLGGFTGATVNLNSATGSASATWTVSTTTYTVTDTITNVDHAIGTGYNDTITGNLFGNKLNGGLGRDALDSGGTSTNISAGSANAGNDTLLGGYGHDTITMHNGTGTDISIDGGVGTDTLNFANINNLSTIAVGAGAGNIPAAPSGTYTAASVNGVYLNLSSTFGVVNGTLADNMLGNAGSGKVTAIEKVVGSDYKDYFVSVGAATIDGGAGDDTIVSAQGGNGINVLKGGAGANVYDGTSSGFKDYFGVGNMSGEVDTIYGFNNGSAAQGDKLYVDISEYASATAGNHALTAGSYTSTTVGTTTTYALNSTQVTVQATGHAVAANANSQFVLDQSNGSLWFDADGNAAGAAVQVATLHANTFTAHTGLSGLTINSTDFILVA